MTAAILQPFVSVDTCQTIRVHQDFQGQRYYHHFGGNPDSSDRAERLTKYPLTTVDDVRPVLMKKSLCEFFTDRSPARKE